MFDQSLIIRLHWAEKTNNFGPEDTSGQSQNRSSNSSQGMGVVPIENVGFVVQRNDVAGVNEAAGTGDG